MDIERIGSALRPSSVDAVGEVAATRRTERVGAGQSTGADMAPVDTVEISDRARELAKVRQAVQDAPDVRADRVAEIKKRIEDGSYSVSPELLARKLLGGNFGGN